jgi:hypothetical protein
MAAPSAIPGVISGPPRSPARIPVYESGAGGGYVGFTSFPTGAIQGVCVAFDSPALTETPLWTRLDDPAGPFIVSEYTIDRGRTYELDKTGTGTATITLIDRHGYFDPSNTGGPFYGQLDPMKQVAIGLHNPVTDTWSTIFRGFTSRWEYDMYPTENYATVSIECVDGMDVLAAAEMFQGFEGIGLAWGDDVPAVNLPNVVFKADDQGAAVKVRIDKVLDQANWPGGLREIFTGNIKIKKAVYEPRSTVLRVIQDAADAEFPGVSNFYFQKDGRATFHGRFARFNPTDANYHISTWKVGDLAAVTGDATRAPIFSLAYDRDKEKIINHAVATPEGVPDDEILLCFDLDEDSINTYGYRSISFENLLTDGGHATGFDDVNECSLYAIYYINNYATPKTRVNTVTFKTSVGPDMSFSDRLWRVVCGVDISDRIDLVTTHHGGGGFNEHFYVEGVHYTAKPLSDEYLDVECTLDLSPASHYDNNPFD